MLVVDDDKAVRTVLQVNLSKQGMHVTLAIDPHEALEKLRAEPYDLVLTDVKMPSATGLELLEKVRASWPDTQVVVMTGYGSVADAFRWTTSYGAPEFPRSTLQAAPSISGRFIRRCNAAIPSSTRSTT